MELVEERKEFRFYSHWNNQRPFHFPGQILQRKEGFIVLQYVLQVVLGVLFLLWKERREVWRDGR